MLSLVMKNNLIQEVESGLTTPGLTIWANPGFLVWFSGLPQAPIPPTSPNSTHKPMDPTNQTPAALPSLKLMEAANRLLKKAETMDNNEIDALMDSFSNAGRERRCEIIAIMFILVVSHPVPNDEAIYEQLKKLLLDQGRGHDQMEG